MMDDIYYWENINLQNYTCVNIPLSPAPAIEDELNIDGAKSVLPCF